MENKQICNNCMPNDRNLCWICKGMIGSVIFTEGYKCDKCKAQSQTNGCLICKEQSLYISSPFPSVCVSCEKLNQCIMCKKFD